MLEKNNLGLFLQVFEESLKEQKVLFVGKIEDGQPRMDLLDFFQLKTKKTTKTFLCMSIWNKIQTLKRTRLGL